nr:hypothetical protein CFP56_38072 [Quercus suber]
MGSSGFLKNLFTQEKSSSPIPSTSKFIRIPRKPSIVLDPLGVVLSKRSRQEEDGVLEEGSEERHKWHRKPFRFEAMWVTDSGCRDTISQAWSCSPGGTAMYATTVKLKQCKQRLKAWSRDHFGHVQSSIKRTKEWLWRAEEDSVRSADKVRGIYVAEDEAEDVLIWPLSSSGSYSVRSAYRMLMEAENFVLPSSSSPLSERTIWKNIWKLKVPKKGLPFDLINEEVGKDISGGIGRVLEVDCKVIAADQARFLRIRVEFPLDKPIQKGALVLSPEAVRVQIAF